MGSISTFLIHNSVVPVSVVRQHEKKKKVHKHKAEPRTLSESECLADCIRDSILIY